MENIKTFENDSQYESASLTRPAVSLIEDTYYKVYYDDWVGTFNGLEIAKGNLYYDGTNFQISDSPFDNSYGEKYGKVAGSYYFNYSELGLYFDGRTQYFNDPTQNNEGIINNNTIDGWRIMSYDEWLGITTNRPNSLKATVNGVKASFAKVYPSNSINSSTSLLLFPDAEVINGCSIGLGWQDGTNSITDSELKEYLDQGCVLLCELGGYSSSGKLYGIGGYWLNSEYTPGTATAYVSDFTRSYLYYRSFDKTSYAPVKLVRNLH